MANMFPSRKFSSLVLVVSVSILLASALPSFAGESFTAKVRFVSDGDTLVVETQNFNEKSDPGLNTVARVYQERISRISETELQYDFTVHDPGTFTEDYTRRIVFEHSDDPIYEYACHEGNYGMMNILSGHRAEESRLNDK